MNTFHGVKHYLRCETLLRHETLLKVLNTSEGVKYHLRFENAEMETQGAKYLML